MTATSRRLLLLAAVLASAACNARHVPTGDASATEPRDAQAPSAARKIFGRECFTPALADDVALVPGLYCSGTPAGKPAECRSGIECLGPWDCDPKPFARCLGLTGMHCVYPRVEPAPAARRECASASDCTEAEGGRCERAITHTTCQYNAQCERDADCGANRRCACGLSGDAVCVAADCSTDSDCGANQRCRRDYACGFQVGGFFCTRAQDECRSDEDCAPGYCDFDEKARAWRCSSAAPCTIP